LRPRGVRRGGDTTQPLPALLHPHTQLLHARAPLLCTRRPHARASGTTVKIRPICNFSLILKFPFTPRVYFTTQSDCEVSSKVTVLLRPWRISSVIFRQTRPAGRTDRRGRSPRAHKNISIGIPTTQDSSYKYSIHKVLARLLAILVMRCRLIARVAAARRRACRSIPGAAGHQN